MNSIPRFEDRGRVLSDTTAITAMIDQIPHHVHVPTSGL